MTVDGPALLVGAAWAAPWILVPIVGGWRASHSTSLDDELSAAPEDGPLISVIVPARDEERNIERCVRSVLASTYPRLEILVVDDHSTDDTPSIVRRVAEHDARARVVGAPPLPAGWFGKPWACATGTSHAHGDIFCFADADTVHSPDLLSRVVHAMRRRGVAMLTVAGAQELGGFWEIVLQPQIFAMLSLRYGGTESVNRSRRVHDKIANGQCIVITRDAYHSVGGHEAVRHEVAEDLMLAQRLFLAGTRTALVLGVSQLSTRMYTSLAEVVRGWRKNIFAGGANALPDVALARVLFPLVLPLFPALEILPALILLLGAMGAPLGARALAWSAIAVVASLVSWIVVYRRIGRSMWYALAYPLGAALLLWIIAGAIVRGRRVSWKGRSYQAA